MTEDMARKRSIRKRMAKTGVRTLTELLRLAIEFNLTSPDRTPMPDASQGGNEQGPG
jgi:hypothetical protein